MITTRANTPDRILFIDAGATPTQSWSLIQVTGLDGVVALKDGAGLALTYPIQLELLEDELGWLSPVLMFPSSGKFIARFQEAATGALVRKPVVVTSPLARESSTTETGTSYATVADMLRRFGAVELAQLADRSEEHLVSAQLLSDAVNGADLGAYSSDELAAVESCLEVLECSLSDASGEIDQYLVGRYALPLTAVPVAMVRNCCDMARYLLEGAGAREETTKRYDKVIKWLRQDVAAGALHLGPAADSSTPAPATVVTAQVNSLAYSTTSLKGWL